MTKTYICNKEFPHLGLEEGDIFPAERYTQEAIKNALAKGSIIEEPAEPMTTLEEPICKDWFAPIINGKCSKCNKTL